MKNRLFFPQLALFSLNTEYLLTQVYILVYVNIIYRLYIEYVLVYFACEVSIEKDCLVLKTNKYVWFALLLLLALLINRHRLTSRKSLEVLAAKNVDR